MKLKLLIGLCIISLVVLSGCILKNVNKVLPIPIPIEESDKEYVLKYDCLNTPTNLVYMDYKDPTKFHNYSLPEDVVEGYLSNKPQDRKSVV